ncbi:MAG: tetratricopeptide repeat protein [Singulisphaera sp.]|nr:tetratricopeptide repeat protein [Singulisphaera sp.]
MAAVDPYSPCPCGSGQKFKWCCNKVEAHAERAQRLFASGQPEAAIKALDEGLRKDPGNAWLLTRKALIQVRQNQPEAARQSLDLVLEKNPKHVGALILKTHLVLETEGPAAGVAQFQRALSATPPENRKVLAGLARVVGVVLGEHGLYAAALKHLALVPMLLSGQDDETGSSVRLIERSASVTPWQKNPSTPSPPPEGLDPPARERFNEALSWAEQGLWSVAASAFELLAAEVVEAERNLGLCRLWLANDAGAVEALRRYITRVGATTEAVDLEALCQEIAPLGPDDLVAHVQLIWPLRDREGLLQALRADKTVHEDGRAPIDPGDDNAPEVDQFALLDRPMLDRTEGLRPEEVPKVVGRVLVGQEIVALEIYDDGRRDGLVGRFARLAGAAITPTQPRSKGFEKVARMTLALSWDWRLPKGVDPEEVVRLDREQGALLIRETWPKTPMPFLGGRTPLQAAGDGDAVVPLRAAVSRLERTREPWRDLVDFAALRATLGLEPEPAIDPETVDIGRLHLARLALVPVERLDDDRLAALYTRARRAMITDVLERAARAMVDRPAAQTRAGVDPSAVHSDLVMLTARRGETAEAFTWIRRGRQADPASRRAANAPMWDMLEVRLRAQTEEPGTWVPELAVILERHGENPEANQMIMLNLMEMGLINVAPNPDRPDDILVDARALQMLLTEYGPKVTTATGRLGVSATRGGIWTPGSETGGGGIWTPGSGAGGSSAGGEKPKLIIPRG